MLLITWRARGTFNGKVHGTPQYLEIENREFGEVLFRWKVASRLPVKENLETLVGF